MKRTLQAFLDAGVSHFVFDPVCPMEQVPAHVTRLACEVLGLDGAVNRPPPMC
jgi:hypothetical protein